MRISPQDIEACLGVLQKVADDPGGADGHERFYGLISKIYRAKGRDREKAQQRRLLREDRVLQATTAMVRSQRDVVGPEALPPVADLDVPTRVLNAPETCYICKQEFNEVHFFYHLLCPDCARTNYTMRYQTADLSGRVALITGGRVKIGYQTVLRLLRDGAKVIVTTRFPNAAARRLTAEVDSGDWLDRLRLYGLDLRNLPAVESFARHLLDTEPFLDILIHNAAQTIRRPEGFYRELLEGERDAALFPDARRLVRGETAMVACAPHDNARVGPTAAEYAASPAPLTVMRDVLPLDAWADNEERADSRDTNSWTLRLDEVGAPEMVEVQLVNAIAPFLLNSRLKPLLLRSPSARRFIVNVSAMEGQFSRHKTVFHPHTNMAKAALNMLTRTSATELAEHGILMTSVDTGWITDERPHPTKVRLAEEGFHAPLDLVDGAARVYDPIVRGEAGEDLYGCFLKDYARSAW